jgi:hypothetical protein
MKNNEIKYEKRDVNVPFVIGISAALIVILVVILVALLDYFTTAKEEMVYEVQLKPESAELKKLQAEEYEILHSYQLLDAGSKTFRIPIDQAMKLVAEESSPQN